MQFLTQEEVIECSQKTSRGKRRCQTRRRTSIPRMTTRQSKTQSEQQLFSSTARSDRADDCEPSAIEDTDANVSGSLFSGQQDLLKQYDEHERKLRKRDNGELERALEQSRKAYEQLKLQTESEHLFSAEDTHLDPMRREVECKANEVAIQTTPPAKIMFKDFAVQTGTGHIIQIDVGVQNSPDLNKRKAKDVEVQASPPEVRMRLSDAEVNTDDISQEDATVQTNPVESRHVGVQKYHSTRVREVGNQTESSEHQPRPVAKRNVCVQQRSSGMLELNRNAALALGIELRCDPTRLQRSLMRVAAKQCHKDREEDESGELRVLFTEEDPYWANHGFFMDELKEDGTMVASDSELSEIEPQISCHID